MPAGALAEQAGNRIFQIGQLVLAVDPPSAGCSVFVRGFPSNRLRFFRKSVVRDG